jgi:hypothetical protein
MADEHEYNPGASRADTSMMKSIVTSILGALAGALLMLLFNSKGMEVNVERNRADIQDITKRVQILEATSATTTAKLETFEKKLDDVWQVTVLKVDPRK